MGPSNSTSRRSDDRIDWDDPSNARVKFADRFLNALIRNTWQSDMSFFLESTGTTIPAHTQIVSVASPVLERMCFNSFGADEPAKPTVITIPAEYSPEVFSVVLEHLYSANGVCEFNEENAVLVMLLADFFDLLDLQNQMTNMLTKILNETNACAIYNQVHRLSNDFVPVCLEYIADHAQIFLLDGSLMRMHPSAVKIVLDQDLLNIEDESVVIQSMIDWARAKCGQLRKKPTTEHMRELLEPIIYSVRFPTMKSDQFLSSILYAGDTFLTPSETSEIMQCILDRANEHQSQCEFSIVPRKAFFCLNSFHYEMGGPIKSVHCEHISIQIPTTMDRNIRLTGFTSFATFTPYVLTAKSGSRVDSIGFTFDADTQQVSFKEDLKLNHDNKIVFEIFAFAPYNVYTLRSQDTSKPFFNQTETSIQSLIFKMPRRGMPC